MLGFSPLASAPLAAVGETGESFSLSVDAGSFATTGQAVNFQKALLLDAQAGLITLSVHGAAKIITEFMPDGQFVVTGNDVSLIVSLAGPAAHGTFTLTGQNVSLLKNITFDGLTTGSFTLTGQPITFDFSIAAASGSFVFTGQEITEDISDKVSAGTFTVTFNDAVLERARAIPADLGQFTYQGHSVAFRGFFDVPDLPEKIYTEQIVASEIYTEQVVASSIFTEQTIPVENWTDVNTNSETWTDAA
mgnify:FL=1|jgi:hypothetical protein